MGDSRVDGGLLERLDISVWDVPDLVAASCVLHNVCEVHGDTFDEDWLESIESTTDINITDVSSSRTTSGNNIRQAFMAYFQEHSL